MFNNLYYPYNSPQPVQSGYRVFPVANIEEAKNSQVNFAGDPMFFYNKAKKEVYFKKFDAETGDIDFAMFVKSSEPEKPKNEDLNKLKEEVFTLRDEITKLFELVEQKKAVKDDK